MLNGSISLCYDKLSRKLSFLQMMRKRMNGLSRGQFRRSKLA